MIFFRSSFIWKFELLLFKYMRLIHQHLLLGVFTLCLPVIHSVHQESSYYICALERQQPSASVLIVLWNLQFHLKWRNPCKVQLLPPPLCSCIFSVQCPRWRLGRAERWVFMLPAEGIFSNITIKIFKVAAKQTFKLFCLRQGKHSS